MPKDQNAQPFQGYTSPNYTPVPDQLFDEQLPDLSGAELKVLLYVMRRTFGFKKGSDHISKSQLEFGIQRRDGTVLDRGTGLSRRAIRLAVDSLVEKNILTKLSHSSEEKGFETTEYALNVAGNNARFDPRVHSTQAPGYKKPKPLGQKVPIQETVKQNTVIQETDNISNIRMVSPSKKIGNGETASFPNAPGHTVSQQTSSPARAANPGLEAIGAALQRRAATSHNVSGAAEVVIPRRRGRPTRAEREARDVLTQYIEDFAREMNDQAPLRSSTTRALNLMQAAELPLEDFIAKLYEARSVTKERTASIRATGEQGSGWSPKRKMPYFFSVLEDLLGLKVETDRPSSQAASK